MESWLILSILGGIVVLLLIIGAPVKPLRVAGQIGVRLIIATLLLFLLNSFATATGLFIPIDAITATTVALLGLPGMLLLVAVQQIIL